MGPQTQTDKREMAATVCRVIFHVSASLLLAVPHCFAFHLPCSNNRQSNLVLPRSPSALFSDGRHQHQRLVGLAAAGSADDSEALGSHDKNDEIPESAQDLRLFLTQRCIQSFMYLLATCTHDVHTAGWLDDFVQPITIDNYWDEDKNLEPGSKDTFLENDKR